MRAPVIGITTSCGPDPNDTPGNERLYVNRLYADCVLAAGGAPVLLSKQTPVETALSLIDGLLIPGGDDIDAAEFGEENHPSVKPEDPERFRYEKDLYRALRPDTPVLGICYGCQALNVIHGGGVLQHIPDEFPGSEHTGGVLQNYDLAGSRLAREIGDDAPRGKSYHHQAVGRIGQGLKVAGRSADGVIEAIETTDDRWVFGVQWHPERTPDDGFTVRLFRSLVQAAGDRRQEYRG